MISINGGEVGGTGGVAAAAMTVSKYRISAGRHGYTNFMTIQDNSMLKASEITLTVGNSTFF